MSKRGTEFVLSFFVFRRPLTSDKLDSRFEEFSLRLHLISDSAQLRHKIYIGGMNVMKHFYNFVPVNQLAPEVVAIRAQTQIYIGGMNVMKPEVVAIRAQTQTLYRGHECDEKFLQLCKGPSIDRGSGSNKSSHKLYIRQ
ncbi:hypothetical protein J6590_075464 [Homalodisca vitripennis]|nr:hypothetical protein J6590_075464 [Homalodisca vitripennis]